MAGVEQADQAQSAPGDGDPDPPLFAARLQLGPEDQQHDQRDQPGTDADGNSRHTAQVQRFDLGMHELAASQLAGRVGPLGAALLRALFRNCVPRAVICHPSTLMPGSDSGSQRAQTCRIARQCRSDL